MHEPIVVYVTAPTVESAQNIGKTVVTEKLAACANILDSVCSYAQWEGQVTEEQEAVCLIKTQKALFCKLEKRICELHPYKVPCIIAFPIIDGHTPFLQWIIAETTS